MIGSASILRRWETDANRVCRTAESSLLLLTGQSANAASKHSGVLDKTAR